MKLMTVILLTEKQEFDGGLLKINIAECQNFKRELFQDKFSKVEIINNL